MTCFCCVVGTEMDMDCMQIVKAGKKKYLF